MKFKTTEEYVLNLLEQKEDELRSVKAELEIALKNIEELKCPVEDDLKPVFLLMSDKPNYFYRVRFEREWYWNKILVANGETPKLVEKALTDKESFSKLCSLQETKNNYWDDSIASIDMAVYNYLFKDAYGRYTAVSCSKDETYFWQVGARHELFLTKEEAENHLKENMLKYIKYYLKEYKDKFEKEKEKHEN